MGCGSTSNPCNLVQLIICKSLFFQFRKFRANGLLQKERILLEIYMTISVRPQPTLNGEPLISRVSPSHDRSVLRVRCENWGVGGSSGVAELTSGIAQDLLIVSSVWCILLFYATETYKRHFMKTAWFQNSPVHLANMEGVEIKCPGRAFDFPDRYKQMIKW